MMSKKTCPESTAVKSKNIYIILSRTGTKFGKTIRLFAKQNYNHAAISLDENFEQVYSFARPQHNAVLLGRLVQETVAHYTLRKNFPVPVAVYKVPVTEEEFQWICSTIQNISKDSDYIYNLFSVLSYPVTHGFAVKKAFSCVEFVTYLLQHCGYLDQKARYRYKPDDLAHEFEPYLFFQGDVRGVFSESKADGTYFNPFTWKLFWESICRLVCVFRRTCASAHT